MANSNIQIIRGNLLQSNCDIIAQQVNCLGVMGAGLGLQIRRTYPVVYSSYVEHCALRSDKQLLLGECFMVPVFGLHKYVANLFGQYGVSRVYKQTNEEKLAQALLLLKEISIKKNLSVGLPSHIGCGLAGGDWNQIYTIIENIFRDYPVTIYEL